MIDPKWPARLQQSVSHRFTWSSTN
jgi:hypothetical protein